MDLTPNWIRKNINENRKFDVRLSNLNNSHEFWFRVDSKPVKTKDFQAYNTISMNMNGDFFEQTESFRRHLFFPFLKKDFLGNLSARNLPPVYLFTNFQEMGTSCQAFENLYKDVFCLRDFPEKGFPRM